MQHYKQGIEKAASPHTKKRMTTEAGKAQKTAIVYDRLAPRLVPTDGGEG